MQVMQKKEDVQAALNKAGLSRIVEELTPLMRELIRVETDPGSAGQLAVGRSKLGGKPDLPKDFVWPLLKGKPLSFVAQINLTEVHPFDVNGLLPAAGLLSFFYDADQETYGSDPADRDGRKVVFVADVSTVGTLHRHAFPAELPEKARFHERAASFSTEITLPLEPKLVAPKFEWTDAEYKLYSDFMTQFPSKEDRTSIHNRMLGHSDTLQDDMHLQVQLAFHGLTTDKGAEAEKLKSGALDWELLLQIDTDEKAGMNWANNGLLYFWIRQQDLKAHQFDDVWVVLQSE